VKDSLDGRTVIVGVAIYGVLLGLCLGAAALWPGLAGVPWTGPGPAGWDIALGLAAGGVIVAASWAAVRWTPSGRRLADLLARTLHGLPAWGALPLALAAGVAEEAAFRGCLWTLVDAAAGPEAAWILTSLAFGLAHGMFRPGLRTWSLFALGTGIALGGLRMGTGAILAPVVAHALVDAVNLPLVQRAGRAADPDGAKR
jgi:membrane protease YdiL (CAAX protease family)